MLQCPKCTYNNELGRIFCHSCGTKLDLSQIKPPSEGAKLRRRVTRTASRTARIGIESIVGISLVLGIVLILLTPEVPVVKASVGELRIAEIKRTELELLAHSRKPGQVMVSEAQLNAYLNSLSTEKPKGTGIEMVPLTIRTSLANDSVKLEFLGAIRLGGYEKKLYLGYDVSPVLLGNTCQFVPNGGWIGKLPLHPWILRHTPFLDQYFGSLFSGLQDDKALLAKMTSITVANSQVLLTREVPPEK